MILTATQIATRGIVDKPASASIRATTYDATVGDILLEGVPIDGSEYRLPRRGMVWVTSSEVFSLPETVTGLATLRTTWTHDGVLALNVGIIDPNYSGPLATALVNFSDKDFIIKKGDAFLRVLFHEHGTTNAPKMHKDKARYSREIADKSARSPSTFLNISSLATEVLDKIFTAPKWLNRLAIIGAGLTLVAILVAVLAIFVPLSYGIGLEYQVGKVEAQNTKREIQDLKSDEARDRQMIECLSHREHRRSAKCTLGRAAG